MGAKVPNADADSKKKSRRDKGDGGLHFDEEAKLWRGTLWVTDELGERKQVRRSSKSKAIAVQKMNTLRTEIKNGTHITPKAGIVTVGDWLDEWLKIVKRDVTPGTYRSYEGTVRLYLKPHIGQRRLDKLTPDQIRAAYDKVQSTTGGEKGSTRNAQKAHQVLGAALKQAVMDRRIAYNPVKSVKNPKHVKKERGYFQTDLAMHILRVAGARDDQNVERRPKLASRWAAAFMTGARQGELLGLEWQNVDLENAEAVVTWQLKRMQYEHGCGDRDADGKFPCGRVRMGYCPDRRWNMQPGFEYRPCYRSLMWTRPKSAASTGRVIPLAPMLVEALKVHRKLDKGPNPHNLVWHHTDGRPISPEDDTDQWNQLLSAAGVEKKAGEAVMHEARNTAATMLLEAGVDAKVISDMLGHATILQTRDYQRVPRSLSQSAVRSAFNALLPEQPGAPARGKPQGQPAPTRRAYGLGPASTRRP